LAAAGWRAALHCSEATLVSRMHEAGTGRLVLVSDADGRLPDPRPALAVHPDIPVIAVATRAAFGELADMVAERAVSAVLAADRPFLSLVASLSRLLRQPPSRQDPVRLAAGDARRTGDILNHPELRGLIDFDRPVAVLMLAVLHFIGDVDDPPGVVARLRAAMAPGSYLAVSHVTADFDADRRVRDAGAVYEKATYQITLRGRPEVMRLFDGFELVDPGLTTLSLWRPDPGAAVPPSAERQWCYAGVGRKID